MTRSRFRFWAWPGELRRRGILGINARNAQHVLVCNPRKYFPRVDDKVLTKRICESNGIPVPETYAIIERQGDVRRFNELIGDQQEFVVKPAKGSEGRGIIVIARREGELFFTSSDNEITPSQLQYHLSTILSGLYSLGGQPDKIIVEQRIIRHAAFAQVAVGGTPDIRIILYRNVPVMAMVRLPTQASRGRANLHQGAIAAAVDLGAGCTFGGVCKGETVTEHPDTHVSIVGLKIPGWDRILSASMRLAESLELGYLGVDFVLDANDGPVVLEANARPGLAIQVANRRGLRHRLAFVDAQPPEMLHPSRRAELIPQIAAIP